MLVEVIRVKNIIQIIKAEILKQHHNKFNTRIAYFSLLIWPAILFFSNYYSYMPFELSQNAYSALNSKQAIIMFLATGFLGYICFWGLVQSAWEMSDERQNGTLETIFLSPVNRIALIYGRALGALFESMWMFFLFSTLIFVCIRGISMTNLVYFPVAFFILIVSATAWGGLMNVIFLFSRDSSILFNIFDEPMSLFSGVRIPTSTFPIWAKIISVFFPLTHSLVIIRSLLMEGRFSYKFKDYSNLVVTITLIVIVTISLLKLAEKHARNTSEFTFY